MCFMTYKIPRSASISIPNNSRRYFSRLSCRLSRPTAYSQIETQFRGSKSKLYPLTCVLGSLLTDNGAQNLEKD